jgi:hypothetical protein
VWVLSMKIATKPHPMTGLGGKCIVRWTLLFCYKLYSPFLIDDSITQNSLLYSYMVETFVFHSKTGRYSFSPATHRRVTRLSLFLIPWHRISVMFFPVWLSSLIEKKNW